MPRPKVPESIRQRAVQACAPCKLSKRRCDCKQPCSNCVKRRDVASCVFKTHLPRVAGHSRPRKSTIARQLQAEQDTTDAGTYKDVDPAASRHVSTRHTSSSDGGPRTAPNMLWTSRGVQVFVGSSASLSFLILLRDTLTKYTGRSSFTDASNSSVMLETRVSTVSKDELCCPYTGDEHADLVDVYHAATSGVLDVLPEGEVYGTPHDRTSHSAVTHAVLAVGAQCRSLGVEDRQCEQTHIAKARDIAFDALRDDQLDVDTVRAFIIMAFYMFGACRRNTAFMYLGIAARASDALGLHLQADRVQIYKSVRILDLLVAALLGRSPATSASEAWHTDQVPPLSHRQVALDASFDVWSIVDNIVQELYRDGNSDIDQIRAFLDRLSSWSGSLSHLIKSDPPQGLSEIKHKEHIIGNTHVSCAYYYAVVITTRKSLITVLHKQLQRGPQLSRQKLNIELTQLAQACVDSALLLVQTCKEVHDAGMLLDNMCLLKAWVFTAGMIVGYAFFVDPETYTGLEQGLRDACQVLQHLSILSPQAKQYHDILQALYTAANEHHQRQSPTASEEQTPLVSKIFSLGQPAAVETPFGVTQSDSTLLSDSLATEDAFSTQSFFPPIGFSTDGMESVAAQFWDELLLDRDQFALL